MNGRQADGSLQSRPFSSRFEEISLQHHTPSPHNSYLLAPNCDQGPLNSIDLNRQKRTMGRRGSKRKSNHQRQGDDSAAAAAAKRKPELVEHITESDDEEIDEDEAFNSEDERMYGHFFTKGGGDGKSSDVDTDDEEVSSDDDDDDSEANDNEEEEDDRGQYMLDLLNKLDDSSSTTKSKSIGDGQKLTMSQINSIPESEYSTSISKKGLTLDNLMEGLKDTQDFQSLQKTFSKQVKATPAPLEKVVASRTERQIAYKNQIEEVSGWTKAIQENRQAETLDFKPKQRLDLTKDSLVDKFEPTTDFEKELYNALEEAGQQDEEAILKREEHALQDDLGANRLTMDEYKKRRGQLAQMRALMFYHEQKRHHMKKIKSKKYRRIRKKQRERMKESELQAAMEDDEELEKELKEKEEVGRIQERMTLAHKNTSKWAKRILKRGKNVDVDTRRALSAQLKRGDDLRKKMMGENDDSDDSGDENLVESARKVLAETSEESDPTTGKKGLFQLSFMQKGIQRQRERAQEEARKLLNELEANEKDDYDDAMEDEDDQEDTLTDRKKTASSAEMKKVLKDGKMKASSLEFGNSNSIAMTGGIEIDLGDGGSDDEEEEVERPAAIDSDHKATGPTNTEHVMAAEVVVPTEKDRSQKSAQRKGKKATGTGTVTATAGSEEAESNPWLSSAGADSQNTTNRASIPPNRKRKAKSGIVDVEGAVDLLDANETEVAETSSMKGNAKADSGDKKLTMLTQEELVRKAFAAPSEDDIEQEFQKEKEEHAARDDPARKAKKEKGPVDVAGWGAWTGEGATPPPPKKRKLPKKLRAPAKKEEKPKRKDDRKPNVIINEKRVKKTANSYLLGEVPHPYSSRAEYEEAMQGGIGREWNVTTSFKNMTRPEILTRTGKIIQPISKRVKVARPAAKF